MPLLESISDPMRSGGGWGEQEEEWLVTIPPDWLEVEVATAAAVLAAELQPRGRAGAVEVDVDPVRENICKSTNVKEKAHGSVTQQDALRWRWLVGCLVGLFCC